MQIHTEEHRSALTSPFTTELLIELQLADRSGTIQVDPFLVTGVWVEPGGYLEPGHVRIAVAQPSGTGYGAGSREFLLNESFEHVLQHVAAQYDY